jgi:phosphoglycolate phosphatase-like HAD superfamily hydrolase
MIGREEVSLSGKTVVFDFDGVIHPYASGWQGVAKTPDPPILEAAESIRRLRRHGYKVVVVSARCSVVAGMNAIKRYLKEYRIEVDGLTGEKPNAIAYIDDRAICFVPGMNLFQAVTHFKPWHEMNGNAANKVKLLDRKPLLIEDEFLLFDED